MKRPAAPSLPGPLDWFNLTLRTSRMMAEAQMVIGYRMLGMAGLWAVTPSESRRMVEEKGPIFAKAALAAQKAALDGARPDQVWDAALDPVGRRTRANAKRLAKRGPSR